MTSDTSQVWLITGCSTGFGRELARVVLAHGACAVITTRDKAKVADLAGIAPDRTLALDLDVTDAAQITAAVSAAEDRFGAIDVLVTTPATATRLPSRKARSTRSAPSSTPTCSASSR